MNRFKGSAGNIIMGLTVLCVAALAVLLVRDTGRVGLLTETLPLTQRQTPETAAEAAAEPEGPLDLNAATEEQLAGLPGIGETLARRIVAYRQTHGAFAAVEELLQVEGIGESRLDAIRDMIVIK